MVTGKTSILTDSQKSCQKAGMTTRNSQRACSTIPLYDGRNVEVGPRARLATYGDFKERGVVAQHVARALEQKMALSKIIDLLAELDTSAPVMAITMLEVLTSWGRCYEGPRGMDVHMAQVANGKTQFYSCLVPTTWNIPTMVLQPKDSTTNSDLTSSEPTIHVFPARLT